MKAGLLIMVLINLTACATVEPWQRGHLAKAQMALEPYPVQSAIRAHVYGSRQAAVGGEAGGGGGCGCY